MGLATYTPLEPQEMTKHATLNTTTTIQCTFKSWSKRELGTAHVHMLNEPKEMCGPKSSPHMLAY